MSSRLHVLAVTSAAVLLTGCEDWGDWGDSSRFKEDFQYTHALKPGGRLSIENANGSIEIIGWERDVAEITGTKYASTEQVLKAMKIDIGGTADTLRIRTVGPSGHRGNHGAKYVLRVPFRTELERIGSSNGSIRVEGIEGTSKLRTSNGSVRVMRVKGVLDAETSNGSVDLNDHAGAATIRTSNGAVRADGVRGYFEATTSNGSITARLSDPEAGRPVKLDSSNGSITLTMDAIRNNDIRATTSNSSITLRLPSSLAANLRAQTSHSSVTTDFDVNVKAGRLSKDHVEGVIGSGGPLIDLSTSNGSIRVLRM